MASPRDGKTEGEAEPAADTRRGAEAAGAEVCVERGTLLDTPSDSAHAWIRVEWSLSRGGGYRLFTARGTGVGEGGGGEGMW